MLCHSHISSTRWSESESELILTANSLRVSLALALVYWAKFLLLMQSSMSSPWMATLIRLEPLLCIPSCFSRQVWTLSRPDIKHLTIKEELPWVSGSARGLVCWKRSWGGHTRLSRAEHAREENILYGQIWWNCGGISIKVFVSHLHAEYCRKKDIYLGHRVLQVFTQTFIYT